VALFWILKMTLRAELNPDRGALRKFVHAMFRHAGTEGYVSLRSFVEGDTKSFRITPVSLDGGPGSLCEAAADDAYRAANALERVVFCPPLAVFLHPDNAKQSNLLAGLALSIECDKRARAAVTALEQLLGAATAIVRSGGRWTDPETDQAEDKLHIHFRIAGAARGAQSLTRLKRARELATAIVDGDTSNVPIVHCIRWPGSYHKKAEPRLCEIEVLNPEAEIDLNDALAALEVAAAALPKQDKGKGKAKANGKGRNDYAHGGDWARLIQKVLSAEAFHDPLARLAMRLLKSGMDSGAAVNMLHGLMESAEGEHDERWRVRYDDIGRAVDTAREKLEPPKEEPEPPPNLSPCSIDEVVQVFSRWLILRDPTPIYAILGTIAANLLPGDPVWLGLIAPPSSAKTEILNSTSKLPYMVQAATVTPAALLSGTPKKQRAAGNKGGLLRRIDQFGIIALKDFGSILAMRPDAKGEILAALREIYDGAWTRHLGTEGGTALEWKGKVGLIFCATGVIDSHYSVIGAMGDRFLLSRLSPEEGQLKRALQHVGSATGQMRKELSEAVARLFAGPLPPPRPLSDAEFERLDSVVSLVVKLRGAVARDRWSREIEDRYGAEGTARLGLTLERLLAGLDTLGVDRNTALDVMEAVAKDSVPPLRRAAYEHLVKSESGAANTTGIARAIGLPTNTVRRALEDLAAYDLVKRTSSGQGQADRWTLNNGGGDDAI
jgi:hypothetical protein